MSNELGRQSVAENDLEPRESLLRKPGYVTRNTGGIDDFQVRLRKHVNSVLRDGWTARARLTEGLLGFISDERNLADAWCHVRDFGGAAAGSDGVTFDLYDPNVPPWAELRDWRDQIRAGVFTPDPDRLCTIPKGGDRGTRSITVLTIRDRVVNRATVQVLQTVLDRFFDPFSFGCRPSPRTTGSLRRGSLPAVATAMTLFDLGYTHWVSEDLRNAFARVPLASVVDVLGRYLAVRNHDHPLMRFIGALLSGASGPGLRQGSPLSPFLLNVYLDHHLDRVWRKRYPQWPLIRYVDDVLVVCRTRSEAVEAHAALSDLLRPKAMLTKHGRVRAVRALDPRRPVAWLGFIFHRSRVGALRVRPGERGWENLAVAVAEPGLTPIEVEDRIADWLIAFAPAYLHCNRRAVYARLSAIATEAGVDDFVPREQVMAYWQRYYAQWCRAASDTEASLIAQRLLPAIAPEAERSHPRATAS